MTLGLSRRTAGDDLIRTGERFLCFGDVMDGRRVKLASMGLGIAGSCSIALLLC